MQKKVNKVSFSSRSLFLCVCVCLSMFFFCASISLNFSLRYNTKKQPYK